jgi:hypothetical protein
MKPAGQYECSREGQSSCCFWQARQLADQQAQHARRYLTPYSQARSEITIRDGRVKQSNFTDYQMLRIHETPTIEVHIVKSGEAPGGIGEPGTAVIPAALTNAIYAATGKRLRQLPVGRQLMAT